MMEALGPILLTALGAFLMKATDLIWRTMTRRMRARGQMVTDLDIAHESRRWLWDLVGQLRRAGRDHGVPEDKLGGPYEQLVAHDPWKTRKVVTSDE